MKLGTGKVLEIRQSGSRLHQAVIQLDGITPPGPGQYLQAHRPLDQHQPTGETLFVGGFPTNALPPDQILTASCIPTNWQPGDVIQVRGPLGRGFSIPEGTSRLALCAFGDCSDHLLPLAATVLATGGEVALITSGDFSHLPASIEISSLGDLPDLLRWADAAACTIPINDTDHFIDHLSSLSPLPCPTQVMIYGHFPCNSMAECGICAFKTKKGRSLTVCQDGPVFDWQEIS